MRGSVNLDAIVKVASKLDAGTNVSAAITIAASEQEFWELLSIHFSFSGSGTPASSSVSVTIGGVGVFSRISVVKHASQILFPRGLSKYPFSNNEAMVITMEKGGANTTAKLNVTYR